MTPLLAIQMRHLRGCITLACRSTIRHRLGNRGEIVLAEQNVRSTQRLRQTVTPARAHQRHDIAALRGNPRNRDLRDGYAFGLRYL
jgi:hypothetical protein